MINLRHRILTALLLIIGVLSSIAAPTTALAQADNVVVRAVLFYSPSCGHCHKVITEDLPPLFEKYGDQLQIIGIDVTQPDGQALYQAAIERFSIPDNRLGVPTLIIDEIVLVGSLEIPEQLPVLIELHLDQGGVDWPDIPGLEESSTDNSEQATEAPATETASAAMEANSVPQTEPTPEAMGIDLPESTEITIAERFAQDPAGNRLAVVVLVLMILSLVATSIYFIRTTGISLDGVWAWVIPALCLVGLVVAGYLAYVEVSNTTAVCGPVGDCNTVQQSEYAFLFGFLPIGVMGLIGYVAILISWVFGRYATEPLANFAILALLGMNLFGVLFSTYLTFLEPFVIGATCAWCLTSAVLMTALLWLSVSPGKLAYSKLVSLYVTGRKVNN